MTQASEHALESLKPAIIRLIVARQKMHKALLGDDNEITTERISNLYAAASDVEDNWTAYEAGVLDHHVSGAVDAALHQLRLRSRHT